MIFEFQINRMTVKAKEFHKMIKFKKIVAKARQAKGLLIHKYSCRILWLVFKILALCQLKKASRGWVTKPFMARKKYLLKTIKSIILYLLIRMKIWLRRRGQNHPEDSHPSTWSKHWNTLAWSIKASDQGINLRTKSNLKLKISSKRLIAPG